MGWSTEIQFSRGAMTEFSSSPPRPDWLWSSPSLLSTGYWESHRWGKATGAWSCTSI